MSVSGLGSGLAPLKRTTPLTVPPALSSAPPTLTGWRFFAFASAFSCDRAVTAAARMIIVNNRYFCMVLAHLKKASTEHTETQSTQRKTEIRENQFVFLLLCVLCVSVCSVLLFLTQAYAYFLSAGAVLAPLGT